MRTPRVLALALLSLSAAPAAGASAAPPPNDDRAAAQAVPALPAYVIGTLVEVATAPDEAPAGSVWYRYVAATDGRFTATFKAFGDLDADVAAFRQQRSQLVFLDAEDSDAKGDAGLSFRVKAGQTVLVRVSRRLGSVADRFSLLLSAAAPEVKPPGTPLRRGGVTSTLDRVLRPAEAYSYTMREGVTYRVNIVPITPPRTARPAPGPDDEEEGAEQAEPEQTCRANVALYAPGTTDFDDRPEFTDGCDAYRLFTPARRAGGRYIFRVFTPRGTRGPQRYHLQVAPAGPNDTAPGTFLANQVTTRGALAATGVNRVDLYRFALKRRSRLKLALEGPGGLAMKLRNDRGKLVEESSAINREIAPGRYFVAIQAAAGTRGGYRLRRSSRTITRSTISISGVPRARGRLGATLTVGLRLRPAVGGPVRVTFQRFDPEAGWQFLRSVDVQARDGRARVGFRPPAVGRFRAKAVYLGTKAAAGSETGFANVLVTAGGD